MRAEKRDCSLEGVFGGPDPHGSECEGSRTRPSPTERRGKERAAEWRASAGLKSDRNRARVTSAIALDRPLTRTRPLFTPPPRDHVLGACTIFSTTSSHYACRFSKTFYDMSPIALKGFRYRRVAITARST